MFSFSDETEGLKRLTIPDICKDAETFSHRNVSCQFPEKQKAKNSTAIRRADTNSPNRIFFSVHLAVRGER